jgi:hypothetical protein
MENNNNQDEGPKKKKSHKKITATIKQAVKETRKVIAKESAPKTKNHLPKYSNTTRPSCGPAGNLQPTNNKRQKNQGVTVDEKNNLAFARADLLTPTKKATDVNKLSRGNFAERKNKTEKKEAKRRVSRDNVPRKKVKSENDSQMDGAPPEPVLGINTRRLLLEDFILLPPLTNVSILVSEDHATYQETFSKLQPKSTIWWDLNDPSTAMHCYEAVVLTNPQLSGLSSGMWKREEIKDLLTSKGGGAIAFGFPSTIVWKYLNHSSVPHEFF